MADGDSGLPAMELPGVRWQPKNVVATYVDEYGEERAIHAPKGRRLSRATNSDTVVARMNRAAAILIGQRIRARRLEMGLTMKELGDRAGLKNANQKAYVNALEKSSRKEGMRFGTIFALATALHCEVADLLPTTAEVLAGAGVRAKAAVTLEAA
jgi:DNA-binding Xre family transcriptional regulator